jgi:hypothetical protein
VALESAPASLEDLSLCCLDRPDGVAYWDLRHIQSHRKSDRPSIRRVDECATADLGEVGRRPTSWTYPQRSATGFHLREVSVSYSACICSLILELFHGRAGGSPSTVLWVIQ